MMLLLNMSNKVAFLSSYVKWKILQQVWRDSQLIKLYFNIKEQSERNYDQRETKIIWFSVKHFYSLNVKWKWRNFFCFHHHI